MSTALNNNDSRWFKANSDSTVTVIFDESKPIRFSTAYWSIHGLGTPIRMMLCAAKLNHINQLYNFVEDGEHGWKSGYYEEKVTKFIPEYTPFMNLPCLADEEEKVVITQLNACLYYLGNICGMMGQNSSEQTLCVQFLSELYDLRCTMTQYVYGSSGTPASVIKGGKEHFGKFEKHLQNKNIKCFTVGDAISAPDFHFYEMIEQYDSLNKTIDSTDLLADYPNVRTFFDEFAKLEYVPISISTYYCS
jgi:Glutathione S-transferase, C-terminal domain